jgi:hypothetical protein
MRYSVSVALLSALVSSTAAGAADTVAARADVRRDLLVTAQGAEPKSELWEFPGSLPSMFPTDAFSQGPLLAQRGGDSSMDSVSIGKPLKSPPRAFLLSFVLPGAGEFYAGARKRAALFFGLEVAARVVRSNWRGEGKDLEDEFRQLADSGQGWDALAYLAWDSSSISSRSSKTHHLPCQEFIETGDDDKKFSDCPDKQQYYELIGKYDQFVAGWKDVIDQHGNSVEFSEIDSVENYHSAQRIAYEDNRNDSNKLLKRATNISGLMLVNHVLSAISAARAARSTAPSSAAGAYPAGRTHYAVVLPTQSGFDGTPMFMAYRRF